MEYLWERISRAFSFIWAAVTMAFRDKDLLIPSLISVVATGAYAAAVIGGLYATDSLWLIGMERSEIEQLRSVATTERKSLQEQLDERIAEIQAEAEAQESAEEARRMAAGEAEPVAPPAAATGRGEEAEESRARTYAKIAFNVAAIFVGYLITYFFTAATISLVYDHISGKDARIGSAFAAVFARAPAIALLAVAATAVQIVAAMARGKRGEENFVSAAIERVWTVASFLILPAIVIEDFSVWKGLKRAREIVSKNLLVVAVGEIAVTMVANVITFLGLVTGVVAGIYIYRLSPEPIYLPLGAGGVIAILAMAFTSYVKAAYYTCLYVNAVESARLRSRAPLPEPLAAALA